MTPADPLTPKEVAERLRVSVELVIRHIKAGRLRANNVSAGSVKPRYRIWTADLEAFRARTANTPGEAEPPAPKPKRRRAYERPAEDTAFWDAKAREFGLVAG